VSAVSAPGKTEDLASILEIEVEVENPPSLAENRDAENSANFVEAGSETGNLETTVDVQVEIEDSDPTAKVRDANDAPTALLEIYDGAEIPTMPVGMPVGRPDLSPRSTPLTVVDRRAHPRYAFVAAIKVIAPESGAHVEAQVRDLSQQGCYVDTNNPLVLGTATNVRITRKATIFEARARVVFNEAGKGMGLKFTDVEPEHLETLDNWIAESRQSSWRATNRRRSQRALMRVPVRVSGQAANGASFEESTHTLSISAHGALVAVNAPVHRGQRFILTNMQTRAALECLVVNLDPAPGGPTEVGIEFTLPNPNFWRVAFPPKDWTPRHPDAKSS
jgi:hypothetical protein